MSSFLGHSVAAITVYVAIESWFQPDVVTESRKSLFNKSDRLLWIFWLIVIASIPDLDYVVKSWHSSHHQGLRITHSVLFSLVMPSITIVTLVLIKVKDGQLRRKSFQVILAGLSHLVLDLLVGVTPLPLLFPLSTISFKLPWGILPSAGKIALNNYYFYRNLLLEMGVILPIFILIILLNIRDVLDRKNRPIIKLFGRFSVIILLLCLGYFILQNLQLPR